MKHTPLVLIGVIAIALASPGTAAAQNLVTNASFDHDVTGWQVTDGSTTVAIAHRTDIGSPLPGGSGPGALEVTMHFWNGSAGGCFQTLPVTGGVEYQIEVSGLLPSVVDNVAEAGDIYVAWYDADSLRLASDWVSDATIEAGVWFRLADTLVAPADATTAEIWLLVDNPSDDTETVPGIAIFDDALFQRVGATEARQELFVPAAASAAGANNTQWSTTAWFANRVGFPVTLQASLLRPGQDNSNALTSLSVIGTVPANGFLEVEDVVAQVGGSEEAGGLFIVATAQAAGLPATLVNVTTTTFTPNPAGAGVYGQGLPAVTAGEKHEVILPGVFQNADRRTNVGILNTSGDSMEVRLTLNGGDGQVLGSTTWALQPYEQRQKSVSTLGGGGANGGFVTVTRISSDGSFRAYLSVVDQHSGDAVYTEGR